MVSDEQRRTEPYVAGRITEQRADICHVLADFFLLYHKYIQEVIMTNFICFIDVFKWMESLPHLSFDARIVQSVL